MWLKTVHDRVNTCLSNFKKIIWTGCDFGNHTASQTQWDRGKKMSFFHGHISRSVNLCKYWSLIGFISIYLNAQFFLTAAYWHTQCMKTNSHPCPQPQEELGSLFETHELGNSLCHHGHKLLHFPILLNVALPYDLPYVWVCQLQRGGHQAKGCKGKGTSCAGDGKKFTLGSKWHQLIPTWTKWKSFLL